MTDNNHPITPPEELVQQWCHKWTIANGDFGPYLATQAARWGADMELEACVEWFKNRGYHSIVYQDFLTARRPKPPSLKEQALEVLAELGEGFQPDLADIDVLRQALESLPD